MDLSGENLVEALGTACGERPEEPAEIVELVHRVEPGFAATLFSAWQAEGIALNAALREDVESAASRVGLYRSVAAELTEEVSSLTTIKGLEVAALYPAGLVRYMNDLDFITPSEADLWRAVGWLTDAGWETDTATFSFFDGSLRVMVSMRKQNDDRFRLPFGIELATYYTLGNQGGIPPILQLPGKWRGPAVKNSIMLLHERYEQPFRARDLVDAALLHESMSGPERRGLHEAVVALNLSVEYAELIRLVNQAGLADLPPLTGGRWTTARTRAVRLSRGAGFFAKPVTGTGRHLQRRLMMAKPGRAEKAAWEILQRRLHPATAIRAGLLGFGLPLGRPCGPASLGPRSEVTSAVLRRRGDLAWADTPAGRFLLTVGDFVSEEAVAELGGEPDLEPDRKPDLEPDLEPAAETSQ
jgi:hypothetical protein